MILGVLYSVRPFHARSPGRLTEDSFPSGLAILPGQSEDPAPPAQAQLGFAAGVFIPSRAAVVLETALRTCGEFDELSVQP